MLSAFFGKIVDIFLTFLKLLEYLKHCDNIAFLCIFLANKKLKVHKVLDIFTRDIPMHAKFV